jgi:hypothetical protein
MFDLSDSGTLALLYYTGIFVGFIITACVAYFVRWKPFSSRDGRAVTLRPPPLLTDLDSRSPENMATGVAETPPRGPVVPDQFPA